MRGHTEGLRGQPEGLRGQPEDLESQLEGLEGHGGAELGGGIRNKGEKKQVILEVIKHKQRFKRSFTSIP